MPRGRKRKESEGPDLNVTAPQFEAPPNLTGEDSQPAGASHGEDGRGPFVSVAIEDPRKSIYDDYARTVDQNFEPEEPEIKPAPVAAPASEQFGDTAGLETEADEHGEADGDGGAEPADDDGYATLRGEQPANAEQAAADKQFYLGTYKDRAAAEAGVREKDATITRMSQEMALLRRQMQQVAQQMQAVDPTTDMPGNPVNEPPRPQMNPIPQAPAAPPFKELDAAEEEALLYSDYGKWRDYQRQRENWLVQQAASQAEQAAFSKLNQGVQQAYVSQQRNKMEADMNTHFQAKHSDIVPMQPYVEAEAQRLAMELSQKAGMGALTNEDTQFLAKVQADPRTLVDEAATRVRKQLQVFQKQAVKDATANRTRLPENPVMPGGNMPAAKPKPSGTPDTPMNESEYMAMRANQTGKSLTNPWGV